MADVARVHPLIDALDGDVVVTRSTRPVVALTPLRADLLVAAHAAGRRVRLETPVTSRLTDPLRDALATAAGSWVVDDGAGARWDGLLGVDADGRPAPGFAQPQAPEVVQLVVAASLRHRAEPGTRVGRALEAVAGLGRTPGLTGWGPHEPVEHAWDPRALTAQLRAAAEEETRLVVTGPSFVGGTLVRRTDKGVEEVLQGLVATRPGPDPWGALIPTLRALAEDALPLFASVLARPGRADLTTAPFAQLPPTPLALLIGAPAVRDLAIDPAALADRFGAEVVGRPRVPGVVVPFTGEDGGWPAFERFVDAIGRERVRRALGALPAAPGSGG